MLNPEDIPKTESSSVNLKNIVLQPNWPSLDYDHNQPVKDNSLMGGAAGFSTHIKKQFETVMFTFMQ